MVTMPEGYVDGGSIGEGGMGDVRLALHEEMGREVAVKILAPGMMQRPDVVQKFENESLTMARLDHPTIVTVHARGWLEDGRPWYAMRLVRGATLAEVLAAPNPALRRLLGFLVAVARGVAHAHDLGVVHCDLKPNNVLVGPFGDVQLLDWGIALRVGERDTTGMGTPPWRAPEQQPGGIVDGGTDVWALGQMLDDVLRACGTGVLTDLVERCRAHRSVDRPTALEFATQIETALSGE
ncbi:MAG: serine/threonine-protein kinase, partial [Myxococcota bacterium]